MPALQHEHGVALAETLLVLAREVARGRQVAAQACGEVITLKQLGQEEQQAKVG